MLSKVASSTIFGVFGMTRPGIEPRSPEREREILAGWLKSSLTDQYDFMEFNEISPHIVLVLLLL